MRGEENPPRQRGFPNNWDVLHDSTLEDEPLEDEPLEDPAATPDVSGSPPLINLLASSWADAVAVLGVCTAALVGLNAAGHGGLLIAFPWAVVLGVVWWAVAAAALVGIRQGTPGMLLAGVVFNDRVAPGRVAVVIAAAAVSALLLGLPGLLGPRRSPLAVAAASELGSAATD